MKEKINSFVFLFIIFGFGLFFIFKPDDEISISERRYLTQKPTFSLESVLSGNYGKEYETYLLDQFPLRYKFRQAKSIASYDLFYKKEYQDIVIEEDYAIKLSKDYEYDKVPISIEKLNNIKDKYFTNNNSYFVLVPEKSCFLIDYEGQTCNYMLVENSIIENLEDIQYIDIKNSISIYDYYKTDSHWSQNKLVHFTEDVLLQMNMYPTYIEYEEKVIEDFTGVFQSQAALTHIQEDIVYLTNANLDNCTVYNYETNKETKIYDLNKLEDEKSLDKYDIFLSGASPLLRIDNPNAQNDKTLYLIRDSFGSSIAPLLVEYYDTIYLIDLRYMQSNFIPNFIEVEDDADVLFLYSTTMISMPNNIK